MSKLKEQDNPLIPLLHYRDRTTKAQMGGDLAGLTRFSGWVDKGLLSPGWLLALQVHPRDGLVPKTVGRSAF